MIALIASIAFAVSVICGAVSLAVFALFLMISIGTDQ